jgi:hypothetical protein
MDLIDTDLADATAREFLAFGWLRWASPLLLHMGNSLQWLKQITSSWFVRCDEDIDAANHQRLQ